MAILLFIIAILQYRYPVPTVPVWPYEYCNRYLPAPYQYLYLLIQHNTIVNTRVHVSTYSGINTYTCTRVLTCTYFIHPWYTCTLGICNMPYRSWRLLASERAIGALEHTGTSGIRNPVPPSLSYRYTRTYSTTLEGPLEYPTVPSHGNTMK